MSCRSPLEIILFFTIANELRRVKSFEETTYSQLVHRDSLTLKAAAKRVPKKIEKANKELVYYTINLSCVFGGKKRGKVPTSAEVCIDNYCVLVINIKSRFLHGLSSD